MTCSSTWDPRVCLRYCGGHYQAGEKFGFRFCAGRIHRLVAFQRHIYPIRQLAYSAFGPNFEGFFPRLILPGSAVLSALLDVSVAMALFLLLGMIRGPSIGWEIITLPVWLAILLIFAFGLGLISAVFSARFRDVQQITPVLLQLLFYASPVASICRCSREMERLISAESLSAAI